MEISEVHTNKTNQEETATEEVNEYEPGKTKDVSTRMNGEQTEGHVQEVETTSQCADVSTDIQTRKVTKVETARKKRIAFFKSVRDAEYKKQLEAVDRDRTREKQQQVTKMPLTDKQSEDFFLFAVDDCFVAIYPKTTSQQNNYNQQPSTSADETYSYFYKTSPKSTSSVSDTSAHAPDNSQCNNETDLTKNVFTPTETKMPSKRSFSDVGMKRQKTKNHLISKLFKRSKSFSNFKKDLPKQTYEEKTNVKEEAVNKKLETPDFDADDFVKPSKLNTKSFFLYNGGGRTNNIRNSRYREGYI